MLKINMVAAVVACACPMAVAVADEFHVRYVGFYDVYAQTFLPDAQLDLEFQAYDDNQDGTYSLDELRSFHMDRIYVPESPPCEYYSCVYTFAYEPGSLPVYTARYLMNDEIFQYNTRVKSGDYFTNDDYHYLSGDEEHLRWAWTPATRTWINGVPVPVPEPATYAMLGLGLAGVLAAVRRRSECGRDAAEAAA